MPSAVQQRGEQSAERKARRLGGAGCGPSREGLHSGGRVGPRGPGAQGEMGPGMGYRWSRVPLRFECVGVLQEVRGCVQQHDAFAHRVQQAYVCMYADN